MFASCNSPKRPRIRAKKHKKAGSPSLQCSPAATPQKDRAFALKNIKKAGSPSLQWAPAATPQKYRDVEDYIADTRNSLAHSK